MGPLGHFMKRAIFSTAVIAIGLLLGSGLRALLDAQELVTLTVPIAKTATSSCQLDDLDLDVDLATFANSRIVVSLTCNNGDRITKQYDQFSTPTGAALLTSLNRGNFTTNSLIKAVYNRLTADGVISGTVSGVPQ